MKVDCTAEIKESGTNQDWYYVRLTVNGRMYFDSPMLRLKIAERTIDELRKLEKESIAIENNQLA